MRRVILLDLPSAETDPQQGRLARLRALVAGGEGGARERIALSTFAVIEGLAEGLRRAGIDDVDRLEVDGEVIFEDTTGEPADLPFIITQAIGAGLLDKPFERMVLQARDEVAGETLLLLATVSAEVAKGEEELTLSCATTRDVATTALDGRVQIIARALATEFGGARWRIGN